MRMYIHVYLIFIYNYAYGYQIKRTPEPSLKIIDIRQVKISIIYNITINHKFLLKICWLLHPVKQSYNKFRILLACYDKNYRTYCTQNSDKLRLRQCHDHEARFVKIKIYKIKRIKILPSKFSNP